MNKFKKSELSEKNYFEDDNGIKINKLLTLIEDSDYYHNIIDYFDVLEKQNILLQS